MMQLKVLSLNMQNGQIWDDNNPDYSPIDIKQTIAFLTAIKADIFFLQEVEHPGGDFPDLNKTPNYNAILEAFPDYYSYFSYPESKHAHLPFGIGLAIFSRYPLIESKMTVLPAAEITFPYQGREYHAADRSLIEVKAEVEGKHIELLNTHLQAYFMIEANANDHPAQRKMVKERLDGRKNPAIIAGDFNCAPGENTLSYIESSGMKTAQKSQITWRRMPYILDHILYSPEFSLKEAEVIPTRASDHHGILATLEF